MTHGQEPPAARPVEYRLRQALDARAAGITVRDLRPAQPPGPGVRRLPWAWPRGFTLPLAGLAAAAAVAVGYVVMAPDAPVRQGPVPVPPAAPPSVSPTGPDPGPAPDGATPSPVPSPVPSASLIPPSAMPSMSHAPTVSPSRGPGSGTGAPRPSSSPSAPPGTSAAVPSYSSPPPTASPGRR
ncbi:hypothetical protein [Streptomyces sp. TBY4]|uniref:hypothetical protein n=1 Tax=Streptomyces sp. TBY4 TaxID=2962030 RepID=UPI0020B6F9CD|nr:hypothetical protein [Streptomyces sp. TBY4]MCP3753475.1 hypothetical protein [Streptomyces sp. TBY4]